MLKILKLLSKVQLAVVKGNYYKAIELNKELTKVLDTYKDAC